VKTDKGLLPSCRNLEAGSFFCFSLRTAAAIAQRLQGALQNKILQRAHFLWKWRLDN
jgi:hypothetical protein